MENCVDVLQAVPCLVKKCVVLQAGCSVSCDIECSCVVGCSVFCEEVC